MRGEFSTLRTEFLQLAVVSALAPHPVQMHRQFLSHRHLGDLPSAAHGQVEERAAPLGLAASCFFRGIARTLRFRRKETGVLNFIEGRGKDHSI
jgi:hypothetical protein